MAAAIRRACLPALVLGLQAGGALAGPEGGQVVAGQGAISRPNANTTVINQASQRLAIDWRSFNVGRNEQVHFNQPGRTAAALNNIFDQNPSQIFGQIRANGRVFLLNPNGIVFSPTARVNVSSLVAAAARADVNDFMSGNFRLETQADTDGFVINQGVIEAATGGDVALAGKSVSNQGVILASAGRVTLAAGSKMTVDFDGDGLMRFAVDEAILENARALDAAVANSGDIIADGGEVLMTARTAAGVFDNAVNNSGTVRAARIQRQGGVIRLAGVGPGASVLNTGTLNADGVDGDGGTVSVEAGGDTILAGRARVSARGEGGQGGSVQLLGDRVGLVDAASVDVSGSNGGGQVLTGGDYRGDNPAVRNASQTHLGDGVVLSADALVSGDGGRVIVWSDEYTRMLGSVSARGAGTGDGGFVEISGARNLAFTGAVDVTAAGTGASGTVLFDPTDIVVGADGTDTADGGDVLFADVAGAEPWNVTPAQLDAIAGNVILQATNNIDFDDAVNLTTGGASLTAQAGNDINVNATITTNNGDINLVADDNDGTADGTGTLNIAAQLNSGGGDINLVGADFNLTATVDAGSGAIAVATSQAGNDLDFDAAGEFETDAETNRLLTTGTLTFGSVDIAVAAPSVVNLAVTQDNVVFGRATDLSALSPASIAFVANAGIALNANVTTNAATTLNTDADTDGGTLTVGNTFALTSSDNAIVLFADAWSLGVSETALDAGTGGITVNDSSGGDIGLGAATVGFDLTTSEVGSGLVTTGGIVFNTAGNIEADDFTSTSKGLITLDAAGNIDFTNNDSLFHSLLAEADGSISAVLAAVNAQTGTVTLTADADGNNTGDVSVENVSATNADITLSGENVTTSLVSANGGNVTVTAVVDATTLGGGADTGDFEVTAGRDVSLGSVQTDGGDVTITAGRDLIAGSGIETQFDSEIAPGNITLTADSDNDNDGDVGTVGGSLNARAFGDTADDGGLAGGTITVSGENVFLGQVDTRGGDAQTPGSNPGGAGGTITITSVSGTTLNGDVFGTGGAGNQPGGFADGGNITFNGAVDLNADVLVSTGDGGGGITFNDAVTDTGARSLTLTAGTAAINLADVTLDGGAGSGLVFNNGNGVILNGSITQVDTLDFSNLNDGNSISLGADVVITVTGAGNDILTTAENINFPQALTLAAPGDITLQNVGSSAALTSLTVSPGATNVAVGNISTTGIMTLQASNTITLNGSSYTSNDANISLLGAVNLAGSGAVTIDADANDDGTDGNINISGAVTDGGTDSSLVLDADTGTVDLADVTVNGGLDVTAVTINLNGTAYNSNDGNISLTGAVDLAGGGAVVLDSDADNDGADGNITVSGDITDGGAASALTADADAGSVSLSDITVIDALAITGDGGVTLTGANLVTTDSSVTISGPTTLGTSVTIDTGAGAGDVLFNGSVDGSTDFAEDLTIVAGTGSVAFRERVGAATDLRDVSVSSADQVTIDASVNGAGITIGNDESASTDTFLARSLSVTATGAVVVGGAAGTGGDVVLSGIAGDSLSVSTDGTIDVNANVRAITGDILLVSNTGGVDITVGTIGLPAAGDFSGNGGVIAERSVESVAGNITTQTAAGGNTDLLDSRGGGSTTAPVDGRNTILRASAGNGSIDGLSLGNALNNNSFPQTDFGSALFSYIGDLALGTTATTNVTAANEVDDTAMDGLLGGATQLTIAVSGGNIILDRAGLFGGSLTLTTDGFVTDASDGGNAFTSAGTLTITSNGAVGTDNFGTGSNTLGVFDLDVGSLVVSSTGGNNVVVTDAGSADTTYNISTGGAGNVTLVQSASNALIDQITTSGAVDITASSGGILDHADDATADFVSASSIALSASGDIGGPGPGNAALDIGDGLAVTADSSAGAVNLGSSGVLNLGDSSAASGMTLTATTVSLTGTSYDSNDGDIVLNGTVELAGAGIPVLDSDANDDATDGNIIFNGAVTDSGNDSGLTLDADTGTVTLNDVQVNGQFNATASTINIAGSGTTINSNIGNVVFTGNVDLTGDGLASITVGGAPGDLTLNGSVSDTGNDSSLTLEANAGTTNVGDIAVNGDVTLGGATVELAGTSYQSTNGSISIDRTVLQGGGGTTTVTSGGGAGDDITFTSNIEDSTNSNTLALDAGTAGDVVVSGAVGGVGALQAFLVNAADQVSLGAVTTEDGGIDIGAVTPIGTSITLNGTLRSDGLGAGNAAGNVRLDGPVVLGGASSIDTNDGGAGGDGNITFAGTVNGANTLGLDAGDGNIDFDAAVGGGTRIGTLTITSVNNLTADAGLTAAAINQVAGSGTSTFSGLLNTNTAPGIDLNGAAFGFDGPLTTTGNGTFTLTNSGAASFAATADASLDGAFLADGAGQVTTAANIVTSADDIVFNASLAGVVFSGDVLWNTAGGGGNITVNSTVVGTGNRTENLTLGAGSGNILFGNLVGTTVLESSTTSVVQLGTLSVNSATDFVLRPFLNASPTIGVDPAASDDTVVLGALSANVNGLIDIGGIANGLGGDVVIAGSPATNSLFLRTTSSTNGSNIVLRSNITVASGNIFLETTEGGSSINLSPVGLPLVGAFAGVVAQREVVAIGGNVVSDVASGAPAAGGARTSLSDARAGTGSATNPDDGRNTFVAGQTVALDNLITENNPGDIADSAFPQIGCITCVFPWDVGDLEIGSIAVGSLAGVDPDGRLSDSQMDGILGPTGQTLIFNVTNGNIVISRAVAEFPNPSGNANIELNASGYITDNTGGVALRTSGSVTLSSGAAIGVDNPGVGLGNSDGALGLDAASITVTSSSGNDIVITDFSNGGGSGDTVWNVQTGGGGNVTIVQSNNDATINQIVTTGSVSITATAGSITDHADDALADIAADGLITLRALNSTIDGVGANTALEVAGNAGSLATVDAQTGAGLMNIASPDSIDATLVSAGGDATLTADGSITLTSINLTGGGSLFATVDNDGNGAETLTIVGTPTISTATSLLSGHADGAGTNDTLQAADLVNDWQITGSGTLNGIPFDDFDNLAGGTAADTFTIGAAGSVGGSIDGGTGAAVDTIDWSAQGARDIVLTNADADGFDGTEASAGGGFQNIESIVGSSAGVDTLTGLNATAVWTIDGGPTEAYDTGGFTLTVADIENFTGGNADDTFNISTSHTGNLSGDPAGGGNDGADSFLFLVNGAQVVGSVDGGVFDGPGGGVANANDTIDWSATTVVQVTDADLAGTDNGNQGNILDEGGDDGVNVDLITGGFDNINTLTGNGLGPLEGPDSDTWWDIDALNSGFFADSLAQLGNPGQRTAFNNFSIQAGAGQDTFLFDFNNVDPAVGRISGGIQGGGGSNILAGSAAGDDFTIVGPRAVDVSVGGLVTSLTQIDIVDGTDVGDTGPDLFNINGNWSGSLAGSDGDDIFTYNGNHVVSGSIDGGVGTDVISWSGAPGARAVTLTASDADGFDGTEASVTGGFVNIDSLAASGAVDSLTGQDAVATWTFDNLAPVQSVVTVGGNTLLFTGFDNLVGGSADDTFAFANSGAHNGSISGGTAAADQGDVLSYLASYVPAVNVVLAGDGSANGFQGTAGASISGGYDNINAVQTAVGGNLTAPNQTNNWIIDGVDSFRFDTGTVPFVGFNSLTGGSGVDNFFVEDGGFMTGGVSGGGGSDSINGSDSGDVWNTFSSNGGSITTSAGETFFGSIEGINTATPPAGTENSVGGDGDDVFTLNVSNFAGTIRGNGGDDVFNLNGLAAAAIDGGSTGETAGDTIIGGDGVVNAFSITGPNAGTATSNGNPGAFTGVENLTGGSSNDSFVLVTGGSLSGSIDGAGGANNTLTGADSATTWTTTGANSGSVTGVTGGFSNIANLLGGAGPDVFNINDPWGGQISGGNGDDRFFLAETASVAGIFAGAGGNDELISVDGGNPNAWNVNTVSNNGTLNGQAFTTMENLTGGADDDNVTITSPLAGNLRLGDGTNTVTSSSGIQGSVFGGAGQDTVTLTAGGVVGDIILGDGVNSLTSSVNLGGGYQGGVDTDTISMSGGAINGDILLGGGTSTNSVTTTGGTIGGSIISTSSGADTLNLQSPVAGSISLGDGDSTITTSGTVGGNITGGSGVDLITLNNAVVQGNVTTFGGDDVLDVNGGAAGVDGLFDAGTGNDTADYANTAGTSVNIILGSTVDNVETIIGSGNERLAAKGTTNTWDITAVNAGTLTDGNGLVTTFSGISDIRSGTGADTFNSAAPFTGQVQIIGDDVWNYSDGVPLAAAVGDAAGFAPGSLAVVGVAGADVEIGSTGTPGAPQLVLPNLLGASDFTGHLIIGGTLNPTTLPVDGNTQITVNANNMFITSDISTGGALTLLAGNMSFADGTIITAGGPGGGALTAVAVGESGTTDGPGDITALGDLNVFAGDTVLIAANEIGDMDNAELDLGGSTLQTIFSANVDEPNFAPSSNAVGITPTDATVAFVQGLANNGFNGFQNVNLTFAASFFNAGAALTQLSELAFIDVSVFEEELELIGQKGTGQLTPPEQCEDPDICGPGIGPDEAQSLLAAVEARIEELERRQALGSEDPAELASLLEGYRKERARMQEIVAWWSTYNRIAEAAFGTGAEAEGSDDFDDFEDFEDFEDFDNPEEPGDGSGGGEDFESFDEFPSDAAVDMPLLPLAVNEYQWQLTGDYRSPVRWSGDLTLPSRARHY